MANFRVIYINRRLNFGEAGFNRKGRETRTYFYRKS